MHKNFTLNKPQEVDRSLQVKPKESTVSFIKQFARVYKIKQMTQAELGVFRLNWFSQKVSMLIETFIFYSNLIDLLGSILEIIWEGTSKEIYETSKIPILRISIIFQSISIGTWEI